MHNDFPLALGQTRLVADELVEAGARLGRASRLRARLYRRGRVLVLVREPLQARPRHVRINWGMHRPVRGRAAASEVRREIGRAHV